MRSFFAAFPIFLFCIASFAYADSVTNAPRGEYRMDAALIWALVPGGGHFYLGETREGAAYAGSSLALAGAAVWLDERNDELDRSEEVNTLWLLAEKDWELSLFTTYRSALRAQGIDIRSAGIDDTPARELFLAPFRAESCGDPMVILAALLGAAAAAYDARDAKRDLGDVTRIGVLGADANRDWGTALYGIDAFGLSLAAGVGEEALWRGVLQNEAETAFGRPGGLCFAAGTFGLAHIVDLDGELSGDRVAVATVAGLYLGYMFQRDGHRLQKPIAAHFWYNFSVMMTSFALDPENNPLGVQVSVGF